MPLQHFQLVEHGLKVVCRNIIDTELKAKVNKLEIIVSGLIFTGSLRLLEVVDKAIVEIFKSGIAEKEEIVFLAEEGD